MQFPRRETFCTSGLSNSIKRFADKQVLIAGNQVTRRQVFLQVRPYVFGLDFHAIRYRYI